MSPHHAWSGASAVKSRRTKSEAARLLGRVRPRHRRIVRSARPSSAMSLATVFTVIRQPFLTSVIQICGEP
ncbi:hypothetical protein AB0O86_30190 [Streptomyces hirsutus]|uniref:hypothetical protein n=1 Tax=Streptomyces hirsutus TaxID=35620 RepID=UPI00343E8393